MFERAIWVLTWWRSEQQLAPLPFPVAQKSFLFDSPGSCKRRTCYKNQYFMPRIITHLPRILILMLLPASCSPVPNLSTTLFGMTYQWQPEFDVRAAEYNIDACVNNVKKDETFSHYSINARMRVWVWVRCRKFRAAHDVSIWGKSFLGLCHAQHSWVFSNEVCGGNVKWETWSAPRGEKRSNSGNGCTLRNWCAGFHHFWRVHLRDRTHDTYIIIYIANQSNEYKYFSPYLTFYDGSRCSNF